MIRWAVLTFIYSRPGGWKESHSRANEYCPGSSHWVEIPTRPPFQRHRVDSTDLDVDGPSVAHSVPLGFVHQGTRIAGDCGGCSRAPLGSTVQPPWYSRGWECHAFVLRYIENHPQQVWNHYWTNSKLLPRENVRLNLSYKLNIQLRTFYLTAMKSPEWQAQCGIRIHITMSAQGILKTQKKMKDKIVQP